MAHVQRVDALAREGAAHARVHASAGKGRGGLVQAFGGALQRLAQFGRSLDVYAAVVEGGAR